MRIQLAAACTDKFPTATTATTTAAAATAHITTLTATPQRENFHSIFIEHPCLSMSYEWRENEAVDLAWLQSYLGNNAASEGSNYQHQQQEEEDEEESDTSSFEESSSVLSSSSENDEAADDGMIAEIETLVSDVQVGEETETEADEKVMQVEDRAASEARVKEARQFCDLLMPGLLTHDKVHCPSDNQYEAVRRRITNIYAPYNHNQTRPQPRPPTTPVVTGGARKKKIYTVAFTKKASSSLSHFLMSYMVDNFVNVTDLYQPGEENGQFNLAAVAQALLGYYVEFSHKKFAKVNLRYLRGCSHLLYRSMLDVETGSDNQEMSRALLAHTIHLLRTHCGYPRLCIKQRVCQNIVLTGQFSSPISLERLLDLILDAFQPEDCPGVIVRLADLERWFSKRADYNTDDIPVMATDYTDDASDDAAFIAEINAQVIGENGPTQGVGSSGGGDEDELLRRLHETDEYAAGIGVAHNCTFLIFSEGQVICTGCKRERQAHWGYTLVFRMLAILCRSDSA